MQRKLLKKMKKNCRKNQRKNKQKRKKITCLFKNISKLKITKKKRDKMNGKQEKEEFSKL